MRRENLGALKRGTIIDLCIRSVKSFLPSTCIYHPDSGFWFNNLEQRSWNKDLVEIWEQRARTRQKTKQKPGQHPSAGKRHICKAVGAGWRTLGAKLLPLALGSPRIALLASIGKGEGKRSTPIKEVGKKGKESEIKLQLSNGDEKEIPEQILNEVIMLFLHKSLLFMLWTPFIP